MLLDTYIYPAFGDERLDRITAEDINDWYDANRRPTPASATSLFRRTCCHW